MDEIVSREEMDGIILSTISPRSYNDILKMIEGHPDDIQFLCISMFCRGIRSVTGIGLMDIKSHVRDHPNETHYIPSEMIKEIKQGKL